MAYLYHVDEVRLGIAITELLKRIQLQPTQISSNIEFNNGFFKATEGDKYEIYQKGRSILNVDAWTEDMIGTHAIADRVIKALGAG